MGDGAPVEAGAAPRASEPAPKAPVAGGDKPSLLGRLKAGLKSLVKRNPPTGH